MPIWRNPRTLRALNEDRRGSLVERLDIHFTEIGDDFLRATMPVDSRTHQPHGLLHGGASVALAETLGSVGASMCVDPAHSACVGLEINANHVRGVRSGMVTGTARPVHIGARTQVWSIEIVDDSAKLVCTSRLTIAVVAAATPGA
jgi:1,4-dihydroxy-2-naphthoyl-CoA hydrolase